MGPTHALSGAALWLGGVTLARHVGLEMSTEALLVSTAVCAGSALLPDIDEPNSTVARTFGPVSQLVSRGVNITAAGLYNVTRGPRDAPTDDGHRKLTHTVLAAIAAGALVSAAVAAFGKPAIIVVFFITLGLALRGLLADAARREGWIGITVITALLAGVAGLLFPAGDKIWWLGLAVSVGMIIHDLGDMITKEGAPLLAPLVPVRGKRWWEFALPPLLRIRAGGPVEYGVYGVAFLLIFIYCAALEFADINLLTAWKGSPS